MLCDEILEFLQNYGTVSKQNAGRYTALHAGRKNFILMEEQFHRHETRVSLTGNNRDKRGNRPVEYSPSSFL